MLGMMLLLMNAKFLSWNMRGSHSEDKLHCVCRLVRKYRPLVVGLQETKREVVDFVTARSLWGNKPHKWIFLPSRGASGGLLLLWDAEAINVVDILKGSFSLSILCSLVGSLNSWACTVVYGPCRAAENYGRCHT